MTTKNFVFSAVLLDWFDQHGRHGLPWHYPRSAYQVWVSEVMLQQTQVQTVIPYFERFMRAFPDIQTLASSKQSEVLAHWAGLGYYARGRNLHRAAQIIQQQFMGQFPKEFEQIQALPGIGRSTAGAILAQAFEQPYAILDGNVKRVLSRFYAIEGWPGCKPVETKLWLKAEALLPNHRLADYTQAMMDLGATLCKRTRPGCERCPLSSGCQAHLYSLVDNLPSPKPKKALPTQETWLLILQDDLGRLAFVKRPEKGIWGGLYSLPAFGDKNQLLLAGVEPNSLLEWQSIAHSFSHFHLTIKPIQGKKPLAVKEGIDAFIWMLPWQALDQGLPAPIKKIIKKIALQSNN
ncbi:A/G-specific adenine glycosylase [Thiomicrospira sp. R3]|uniref:A/G-specific adenine glycosylase n=1 Tax=Thiomicrospira sp. R3 TaxID=3035472 RepID=UPI00259B43A0|nr:A/G-specific adenine glycosylase [Thiomicrospira sp. R3]WFE69668.1 A/G-specific adenine glycosylase [Thiomicrospira sp. R3]